MLIMQARLSEFYAGIEAEIGQRIDALRPMAEIEELLALEERRDGAVKELGRLLPAVLQQIEAAEAAAAESIRDEVSTALAALGTLFIVCGCIYSFLLLLSPCCSHRSLDRASAECGKDPL